MTKQELEYLSKFENNFKTAMEQGYTNPIPSVHKLKNSRDIWKSYWKKVLSKYILPTLYLRPFKVSR